MKQTDSSFAHLSTLLDGREFLGDSNPMLLRSHDADFDLAAGIAQYAFLPAHIVDFLDSARQRLVDWTSVADELSRNIGEELGSRTRGRSHFDILASGLQTELGLHVLSFPPSRSTTKFLSLMTDAMRHDAHHFVAGCAYALEDSAVPELTVVTKLLNTYAERVSRPAPIDRLPETGTAPGLDHDFTLRSFFWLHINDFEIGHRTFLASALAPYLEDAKRAEIFERGYVFTLDAMAEWWSAMAFQSSPQSSDSSS